ncbi:Holliday junction resolvase RuvX [Pedomonas mirosovicensis]|uniref:Holliday junction resolvase RuvX n=1 Tax=Pedomonas mirosovicensis TaxID=2908641 RepID=UPI002167CE79|nr:Holliday junction resolvase RuvX [Pedomonas mirosovicensis]MCH8684896.1 Holliday junction resolvase RuvX [Pedomonas mirosovicensis]
MITQSILEFLDVLPEGGRLAGLDVGDKRIGVAFCDAMWTIATPAETLQRQRFTQDANWFREQFAKQSVKGIVIGLPLNMDGTDSPQTQSIRAYARNLDKAFETLPILMWDERWSTAAVTRAMIDADLSRAKRAERVDKAAAAFILQGAIDALAAAC